MKYLLFPLAGYLIRRGQEKKNNKSNFLSASSPSPASPSFLRRNWGSSCALRHRKGARQQRPDRFHLLKLIYNNELVPADCLDIGAEVRGHLAKKCPRSWGLASPTLRSILVWPVMKRCWTPTALCTWRRPSTQVSDLKLLIGNVIRLIESSNKTSDATLDWYSAIISLLLATASQSWLIIYIFIER